MLTRARKEEWIADLKEKFGRASCVYFADYRGLDVESVNALRRRLRDEGRGDYEYRVIKNSVLTLASRDTDVSSVTDRFKGPTAVALSYGDPIGLAKILTDFAKEHEVFSLKAGVLEGGAIDVSEIVKLATLPSLEQLRAHLVGLIRAPATKLARLVSEPGAQLARVLGARGRQEGET